MAIRTDVVHAHIAAARATRRESIFNPTVPPRHTNHVAHSPDRFGAQITRARDVPFCILSTPSVTDTHLLQHHVHAQGCWGPLRGEWGHARTRREAVDIVREFGRACIAGRCAAGVRFGGKPDAAPGDDDVER